MRGHTPEQELQLAKLKFNLYRAFSKGQKTRAIAEQYGLSISQVQRYRSGFLCGQLEAYKPLTDNHNYADSFISPISKARLMAGR